MSSTVSYSKTGPLFMILPSELEHLEEKYKKLWVALHDFDYSTFVKLAHNLPLAKARDSAHNSVLHFSAAVGNPHSLAYVLNRPSDRPPFDAVNFAGYTALQVALMNITVSNPDEKLREVVRLLLEAGDDPRLPRGLDNALASAAQVTCPVTIYRMYLSALAREPNPRLLMKMLSNADWSIKHFIWTKDLDLLKLLIEYDKNVLKRNNIFGVTALHQAVEARAPLDVFTLMLSYDLNVNAATQSLNTPLHRACELAGEWDNLDVVEKLISAGANPTLRNRWGRNCLHMAAKSGSEPLVRRLIKHNVNFRLFDVMGKNAIHLAAMSGSIEVIATLDKMGLSMKSTSRDVGATALHFASRYCRPETVAYLLSQGLDVNKVDSKNKTALHYAVRKQASNLDRRCTETVDMLVDHGGQLFDESNGGSSILRFCIEKNYLHNASIIMRHLALNESKDPKVTDVFMKMIKGDNMLKDVYNSCVSELKLMKEFEVYGWVTMYKMLTATDRVLKPLMRNADFVIKMNSCIINRVIHTRFPIYCTRIINRYTVMEKQQRKINNARKSVTSLIGFSAFPDEVIDKIVSHLNTADIDRLAQYKYEMTAESLLSCRKNIA